MMKKQILSGFFIACAAYAGAFPLGAEAATLPPGNPFYFMQDGMRALRRTFTFSPVSRAMLELRMVNERQADVREVVAAGTADEVVDAAFAAYGDEVAALASAMDGVTDDRAMAGAAQAVVAHMRFWNEMGAAKAAQESGAVRERVAGAKRAVIRFASGVFRGDLGAIAFRRSASLMLARETDAEAAADQADALVEIDLAAADLVAGQAGNSVFLRAVRLAKDEAFTALVGAVRGGAMPVEAIAAGAANPAARIYVIEGMRARVGDVETKSALGFVLQRAVEDLAARRISGAGMAREAIVRAESAAATIPAREAEEPRHFIEQAGTFLMGNEYDLAFQNAVTAYSLSADAALAGAVTPAELREEVSFLKRQYDRMGEERPVFMEKRIGAIADLSSRTKGREALAAIREARIILSLLHSRP